MVKAGRETGVRSLETEEVAETEVIEVIEEAAVEVEIEEVGEARVVEIVEEEDKPRMTMFTIDHSSFTH